MKITITSTIRLSYDRSNPFMLSVFHEDGYIDGTNGSVYFSEHDGESIAAVLQLMIDEGILPKGSQIKDNDCLYTGKGNTSDSIWVEHYDEDQLAMLDDTAHKFRLTEDRKETDGETEVQSQAWEIIK